MCIVCVCVCVCVSESSQEPSLVVHTTHSQRLLLIVLYVTFRATYSVIVTFTVFAMLVRHVNRQAFTSYNNNKKQKLTRNLVEANC